MSGKFFLKLGVIFFLFIVSFSVCFAHQPRLVEKETTVIENPEISQAFYAELTGSPQNYAIQSDIPFKLYVGLLVPDLPDSDTDYIAKVTSDTGLNVVLDGNSFEWESFYEEFGGDDYLNGPEYMDDSFEDDYPHGVLVDPGLYTIEVSSSDNRGKYVLVVGEIESFSFSEIVNTIKILPKLKSDFFEKSAFTAFFNLIGLFLLIPVILIILLVIFLIILYRRYKNKKVKKK